SNHKTRPWHQVTSFGSFDFGSSSTTAVKSICFGCMYEMLKRSIILHKKTKEWLSDINLKNFSACDNIATVYHINNRNLSSTFINLPTNTRHIKTIHILPEWDTGGSSSKSSYKLQIKTVKTIYYNLQ
ncbi:zinc finger CCCH-type/C3HC4-type RING finger family protein, partial [Striga asiatica]